MDLSANCSSRLSARVSDLHPVFLSEWVDTDPADEMTRVSVHPPGHSGVCCAAYCYGGLINQPFVDLWSTFSWSILRLGARLHSVCVCVDGVFPAADAEIKTRWPSASLACHGTLNTISSLSWEGQLEETLGGIRPKQAGQIKILIAGLWRRKDRRAEKE